MHHSSRPLWAQIDLEAIERNYLEASRRAAPRTVIAAIKGDAYGHGCIAVARLLERHGAILWTGNVPEALAMREARSEEHPSELQSLMRISYAVFCLQKK